MTEPAQTVPITLQLPKELHEELKRAAVNDLRPMKEELIVLLREALDNRSRQE